MNTKATGTVAELLVITDLLKRGYSVSVPVGDNARYDLIVDADILLRVQVKGVTPRKGKLEVPLFTMQYDTTKGRNNRAGSKLYGSSEIDLVAAVDLKSEKIYYIIMSEFDGATVVTLRLEATKNNQSAGVRLASDYEKFILAEPSR